MSHLPTDQALSDLVAQVQKSAKYRHVSPELIQSIGAAELAKRPKLKEAVKATKNKLHQVSTAYLIRKTPYQKWAEQLQAIDRSDTDALKNFCKTAMAAHASTHERLSILDEFYEQLFAELSPINSLIDIACGLNPLALPWMNLAPNATYHAYDIHQDMIDFLNIFLAWYGQAGAAKQLDVTQNLPTQAADVALILKTLPCLEQIDKEISSPLLEKIPAKRLIISFPVQSLGGRDKGMSDYYEAHFMTLIQGKNWTVKRFKFQTELAFTVTK